MTVFVVIQYTRGIVSWTDIVKVFGTFVKAEEWVEQQYIPSKYRIQEMEVE